MEQNSLVQSGSPDNLLRAEIIVTCLLSVIGSVTIISSYVFFKSLRSTRLMILVHLSIMDLGVAITNLVGVIVKFDTYYYNHGETKDAMMHMPVIHSDPSSLINVNTACITQALAVYFTAGSFMWTLTMAIYMYFKIVQSEARDRKLAAQRTYYAFVVFSYVFPLILVGWKFSQQRLGYSPLGFDHEGWCGDITIHPVTGKRCALLQSVLGYNFRIFLLIGLLVSIIYFAVLIHLRLPFKGSEKIMTSSAIRVQLVHVKLNYIPFAFLVLWIWSFISVSAVLYLQIEFSNEIQYVLLFLSGIGESGQGFVNAVLFVLEVRDKHKYNHSQSNDRKKINV